MYLTMSIDDSSPDRLCFVLVSEHSFFKVHKQLLNLIIESHNGKREESIEFIVSMAFSHLYINPKYNAYIEILIEST